jgi:hypothetical protein
MPMTAATQTTTAKDTQDLEPPPDLDSLNSRRQLGQPTAGS